MNNQILRRPQDNNTHKTLFIPRPPRDLVFNSINQGLFTRLCTPERPVVNTRSLGGLGMNSRFIILYFTKPNHFPDCCNNHLTQLSAAG